MGAEGKISSEKVFVKVARPTGPGGENERWAGCEVSPTLNVFDNASDVSVFSW